MSSSEPTPPSEHDKLYEECEQRVGYSFRNRSLLAAALTHASGARHRLASNERLEFLGDAVLGLVVCEHLFQRFPHYLEGELTRIKSVVVSRRTCAKISDRIGLAKFLFLGKGMAVHDTVPRSLLSDVFESLVAAIYLDSGIESARKFIEQYVVPEIDLVAAGITGENPKSQLQQLAQRTFSQTPNYVLIEETGPDHSKSFRVAARIGGRVFASAWGTNKKEAEQRAALHALEELERELDEPPPTINSLDVNNMSSTNMETGIDDAS
ncbi:MAG: ribonuclease III [Pirellulaceae bacterium]|nr:ribonuclease III [Planctomycetales bacterium]